MIKFFRKNRQQLLSEGKTGKYLKYAIGEVALVVIGILIAISINNWNEDIKNDEVRRMYYIQILQDLEKEKTRMEAFSMQTDLFSSKAQSYKEIFKEPDLPLLKILNGMTTNKLGENKDWNNQTNTNTITTLLSTGDIKLIPPILINKLLDLKHEQLGVKEYNEIISEAILAPTVTLSTLYGGLDLGRRIGNQPKLIKYLSDENRQIQIILSAEGITDRIERLNIKVKNRYTKLLIDIEEITELINEELKK